MSKGDRFSINQKYYFSTMKYKAYSEIRNTKEVPELSSILGKATVSGGTNLIKLGKFHGKTGAKPEYTHFLQYMNAYAQARKEYLLEKANRSEQ